MIENIKITNDHQELIVVLGMHRSGTSVITRGLKALGINLGNRLMPAVAGNNDKGFWEDLDIVDFNERLLKASGCVWHTVQPLQTTQVEMLCQQGYLIKAVALLRSKLDRNTRFGFKDPRTAKLLPFWKRVFEAGKFNTRYLVALRNPISVADSLEKRDGLPREKSYLLWLSHVLTVLMSLADEKFYLFDYDNVIESPDIFLQKLANFLESDIIEDERVVFIQDFLTEELRHSLYLPTDVAVEPASIALVKEVYAQLIEALEKTTKIDTVINLSQFNQWELELSRMRPALALVDHLDQAVTERDGQIASLTDEAVRLNQAVADRDGQIASLTDEAVLQAEALNARGIVVAQTQQELAIVRQDLAGTQQERYALYTSRSWRVTAPMRFLSRRVTELRAGVVVRVSQNAGRALRGEVKRHGYIGVLRRLPYYLRRRDLLISLLKRQNGSNTTHWSFESTPAMLRPQRLHPDLTGDVQLIMATVSVVIPTLNAGPEFVGLLRKLMEQQGIGAVEVVIVDSGSSDSTVDVARQWGCNLVQISPEEFSHSGARNLGAAHAKGDYLLFMVQDAYPIGAHWIYGMLRYLHDHMEQGLVAVSCAETSRSDSDMMYDSMIDTHYRFLGCHDQDRLGHLQGLDHMALRSQGQLSDVACLIGSQTFSQYHYRGDYAEDLDLGMRIIRDGKAVAMLASVKVIHSHNRPAYYYLKRSFVDVVFLVGMFDDFTYSRVHSMQGLMRGICAVAAHLSGWLQAQALRPTEGCLGDVLQSWVRSWRRELLQPVSAEQKLFLADTRLEDYVRRTQGELSKASQADVSADADDVQQFIDLFLARVEHFHQFAGKVYARLDGRLREELHAAVVKIFAASAGSALGFAYVQFQSGPKDQADRVKNVYVELKAGV